MAWNRPTSNTVDATSPSRPSGRSKMPRLRRGLIAGAIVVVLGFAVLAILSGGGDAPKVDKESHARKIATAKTKIRRTPAPIAADTGNPKLDAKLRKMGAFDRTVEVEVAAVETPPEEFIAKAKQTKPVFSSGVEQLMSLMFTCQPGNMPFPLVQIPDSDYKNLAMILISKNEIEEGDSEEVKYCKETVMAAKKEMIAYIKQGGDPDEFMAYYHAKLLKDFNYRNEARHMAQEAYEEDPSLGRELVKKLNDHFGEEGIKPLSMREVSADEDDESEVSNEESATQH